MVKVILGDLHNRQVAVRDLFEKIGLIDESGNRVDGFHVIQLGDLLSLGYGEQEAEFLKWVRPFIDEQLIGNHEFPVLAHFPHHVEFAGWDRRDIVAEQMVRSEYNVNQVYGENKDLWKPATNVGKWLITHAGASPAVLKEIDAADLEAAEVASKLNKLFEEMQEDRDVDPVFYHPGESNGGIFWLRLAYLRAGYQKCHVPQIVGHTPYMDKMCPPAIQNRDKNLWCIDSPGSAVALVTEDDGETFELVQSDFEYQYGAERQATTIIDKRTKEEVGLVQR